MGSRLARVLSGQRLYYVHYSVPGTTRPNFLSGRPAGNVSFAVRVRGTGIIDGMWVFVVFIPFRAPKSLPILVLTSSQFIKRVSSRRGVNTLYSCTWYVVCICKCTCKCTWYFFTEVSALVGTKTPAQKAAFGNERCICCTQRSCGSCGEALFTAAESWKSFAASYLVCIM